MLEWAEHYHKNANMWRITDDFWDHWDSLRDMFDRCRNWQDQVKDGGYPDCDMLPLGWLGKGFQDERQTNFSKTEQRTMMTLWCMFRSPLMLGAELPKLDDWTLSLLCNDKVLGLLEGSKGAREIFRDEQVILWQSESTEGSSHYLAVFNISEDEVAVAPEEYLSHASGRAEDLWEGEALSLKEKKKIPPHGCLLLKCD